MLKQIRRRLVNIPGWHTRRKIVVFDSDDWGSIGLPSKEVFARIQESGFRFEYNPYLKYDALASEDDLSALFESLGKFTDRNGRHPVFTANTVMANPDFDKIRSSGFTEYHYEWFTDSLKKYPQHSGSFGLWQQGMQEKLFYPQFHAREHLNVAYWMKALKAAHPQLMLGFDNNFYILDKATHPDIEHSCTSAHYPKSREEYLSIEAAIKDGLEIFESIFGFRSGSFTGTGYIWASGFEKMLSEEGVKFLKGLIVQSDPDPQTGQLKSKYHYTGQMNKYGQIHLVRNAFFEPGLAENPENTVADCLDRIATAFSSGKPAVISTHRINYIGYIDEKFRTANLSLLKQLIKELVTRYPDVEFMTSDELGSLIEEK